MQKVFVDHSVNLINKRSTAGFRFNDAQLRIGLARLQHDPERSRRAINKYSWRQLIGAGALAGIGFTMSLFIASQVFPTETDFAAAKIAVFAASIASAILGVAILWNVDG